MSGLADVRGRLRDADRRVARALKDLDGRLAALGPSEAEILAVEVAALHRAPSLQAEGALGAQLDRIRDTLRAAGETARRVERQRHAARRAAWTLAAGDLGAVAEALPEPEPDPRAPAARLLRHGWVAGLTIGALMLGDGLATLLWQEPISALHTSQAQDRLDSQLPSLAGAFGRLGRDRAPDFAADARRLAAHLPPGRAVGRIELPSLGTGFAVVQGTSTASLESGPGHYAGTVLPGEDGTVGVAGHRTTYLAPFRGLDRLAPGARVVVEMPYGRFTYRVTRHALVDPARSGVLRAPARGQRLVLTTCDPVFSDARRLVVFARLVDARR